MSTRAKITFGTSLLFTTSVIAYVHWSQEYDRKKMYQNVLNDILKEQKQDNNNNGDDCPTGICDLKTSRIVD